MCYPKAENDPSWISWKDTRLKALVFILQFIIIPTYSGLTSSVYKWAIEVHSNNMPNFWHQHLRTTQTELKVFAVSVYTDTQHTHTCSLIGWGQETQAKNTLMLKASTPWHQKGTHNRVQRSILTLEDKSSTTA